MQPIDAGGHDGDGIVSVVESSRVAVGDIGCQGVEYLEEHPITNVPSVHSHHRLSEGGVIRQREDHLEPAVLEPPLSHPRGGIEVGGGLRRAVTDGDVLEEHSGRTDQVGGKRHDASSSLRS